MNEAGKTERSSTPEKVCPSCGQANPATAGICWKCGRSIRGIGNSPASLDTSSGESRADVGGKSKLRRK